MELAQVMAVVSETRIKGTTIGMGIATTTETISNHVVVSLTEAAKITKEDLLGTVATE